jgi:hypothetical protein
LREVVVTDNPMEPMYGASQPIALAALGHPDKFWDCVAVILDKGGDSGYWMRLLGNENFQYRRVGALVITHDEFAYGELVSSRPKPRSGAGATIMLARGKNAAFADFVWIADRDEIDEIIVHPVNLSPHGAYASVELSAYGRRVQFGLDVGRPHVQNCISALRHIAGAELDLSQSAGVPRTDGIYLLAANNRKSHFQGIVFHESKAGLLALSDVPKDLAAIRSGTWQPNLYPYKTENDHYVIDHKDPGLRRHIWIQGDRLVGQIEKQGGLVGGYGQGSEEYLFVPDSELIPGWGSATIPWPLPAPSWGPVLSATKDLVAEDIGVPKARMKG